MCLCIYPPSLVSYNFWIHVVVVQLPNGVWLLATIWTAASWASLSFTISQSLRKLMSLSQWYHPTICRHLFLLPSVFPSIKIFSNESALPVRFQHIVASASVLPMNSQGSFHLALIWLHLLTVQGTLKSLLQNHSSKASILQHSAFFTVQLAHPYMTTGKIYSFD